MSTELGNKIEHKSAQNNLLRDELTDSSKNALIYEENKIEREPLQLGAQRGALL
jgi:hypothetical protein